MHNGYPRQDSGSLACKTSMTCTFLDGDVYHPLSVSAWWLCCLQHLLDKETFTLERVRRGRNVFLHEFGYLDRWSFRNVCRRFLFFFWAYLLFSEWDISGSRVLSHSLTLAIFMDPFLSQKCITRHTLVNAAIALTNSLFSCAASLIDRLLELALALTSE